MNAAPDDDLSPQDQLLLRWLEDQSGRFRRGETFVIPPELLAQCERAPELAECLRVLDAIAAPNPQEPGSSDRNDSSPSSLGRLPREFGPYLLERELGRGGMGVVYLAQHRMLQSYYALKMIRTSEFASEEEVRRFFREAQAAARLRHPHVVGVHDAGEIEGLPYLVMQYISGSSLQQRLREESLSPEEGARLLSAVARAVHYLHEQGIVHRDLKPGNILLDERGEPWVTDFGLAKLFSTENDRTTTGTVIGTPAYMSPEQAWGRPEEVTAASDVYSLGAILYELLSGRPPFPEANPFDQMLRLRDAEPRPLRLAAPHVPVELEQICLRCLEKKPENRYGSAARLAEDLDRFRNGEPPNLAPLGWWNRVRRWMRREPALASHLGAFIMAVVVVQVAELFAARQRPSYIPVMVVLTIWVVLSTLLQKLLLRDWHVVKLVWVAVDAILFTLVMALAEQPIESLFVGYAMLIAASGLWYEKHLVWLMTGTCVVSYLALWSFGALMPSPAHYPFLVTGVLIVTGAIVGSLVQRIRQLLHLHVEG